MYFGSVVSKDRIICKLEWLLKKVVEAFCKGGQAAASAFRYITNKSVLVTTKYT